MKRFALPLAQPNAIVEYVDERTKTVVATDQFYDPGLDEASWYAREQKARGGIWRGPHLAYTCGKPLAVIAMLTLASCGGNLAPVAASLTPIAVSAETAASLRTWCARGQPLIDIARGQNLSSAAREIADFVGPYCQAMASGTVPATTDGNTPTWLPTNIMGLAQALGSSLR